MRSALTLCLKNDAPPPPPPPAPEPPPPQPSPKSLPSPKSSEGSTAVSSGTGTAVGDGVLAAITLAIDDEGEDGFFSTSLFISGLVIFSSVSEPLL